MKLLKMTKKMLISSILSLKCRMHEIKNILKRILSFKNLDSRFCGRFRDGALCITPEGDEIIPLKNLNHKKIWFRKRTDHELQKKPWFILIGESNSGKKSILNHSTLDFMKPHIFGPEAIFYTEQYSDYQWSISNEAVFISLSKVESNAWKKLIKLLRRERKKQPINGVIITITLRSLITQTPQERTEQLQTLHQQLRELYQSFKAKIPVYLIFTKCDQVEGFMEFFNDLNKEELQQIWGITFPLSECSHPTRLHQHFNTRYNALIHQLRKRVLWSFDTERNPLGRELINNFPQQMQLLKKPLEHFILEFMSGIRHQDSILCRGLYFVSATQTGESTSFLQAVLSKKFQLIRPCIKNPQRMRESYFLTRLLPELILPDASPLGHTEHSLRAQCLKKLIFKIGPPLLLLSALLIGILGYQNFSNNIDNINTALNEYHQKLDLLKSNQYSLPTMTSVFNTLKGGIKQYQENTSWNEMPLLANLETKLALNKALNRSLQVYLLPKIALDLESNLNENISDPNLLYALFKAYLAFNDLSHTSQEAIKAPMDITWSSQFQNQEAIADSLKKYLIIALKNPIEKLPVDQTLIHRLLGELANIIPAERAYGLLSLRADTSELAPLNIRSTIGENFDTVFTTASPNIPALYTHLGFRTIFIPESPGIAKEVSQDNQDMGLDYEGNETQNQKELLQTLETQYNKKFQEQWLSTLHAIHVKPSKNLSETISVLEIITSEQSPFLHLLHIITDNTDTIHAPNIEIKTLYTPINRFSEHGLTGSSWNKANDALKKLTAYLKTINQSPAPNKAAFNALVSNMQGQNNPFQDLNTDIQTAPPFIKSWLQEIYDNSWNNLVSSAQAYMNTIWSQTVLPEYTSNIQGHYPLVKNDIEQINTSDFNHFFGPTGTLDTYFNTYLKSFINTSPHPWSLYQQQGHSAAITNDEIHFFEQAEKIRKDYFPGQAKETNLQLSFTPKNLSENSKAITLSFGDQSITYRHGPQEKNTITWPLPKENQNSSLVLSNFNDDDIEDHANGPWSLFEIIHRGTLKPTGEPEIYRLTYHFEKSSAMFLLSGGSERVLSLADFKDFIIPKITNRETTK